MRLQGKVTLFFLVFFLMLLIQGVFFISHERRIFYREMEDKGRVLAENLAEISKESVISYQFSRLSNQIESIQSKSDIEHISIVNENNLVIADTRKNMEGWIFSGVLPDTTQVGVYGESMRVTSPVYVFGQKKGSIEISFNLTAMNKKIQENILVFLTFLIFEVLAAILFMVVFELQVVKPLDLLARKVTLVTPDSLVEPIRLPGSSSREILRLADAIEGMKTSVQKAQTEIIAKTKMATMGKISANFAHEIRNPLEAISGSVEILSYSIDKDTQEAEYLTIIREEISNLNNYLENFLEFSKAEPAYRSNVMIKTVLEDTLLLLRPLFAKKHIACELRIEPDIPESFVDTGQIKRVLLNLLLNGIEALDDLEDDGAKYVKINATRDSGEILLEIEDNGCGIPPEFLDKVFDPYFTTKQNGSGIGLALCSSILLQNNGSIRITATSTVPPRGTTVSVRLPSSGDETIEENQT